jgi:uncharacterized protein
MKKTFLTTFLLSLLLAINSFGQTRPDLDLTLNKFQTLYNSKQYDNIFNMLSERIKTMMPLDATKKTMEQLQQTFGEMKSYSFVKQEEQLAFYKTTFSNSVQTLIVSLDKDKKLGAFRFVPYTEESAATEKSNFIYKSPTGKIFGTLLSPESKTPVPVVLIIAGSGPTDRNCNQANMKTNSFSMLADSLKKAGIASVRYDKRGIGESAPALKSEEGLRFDDMINDAIGFIKMLKADKRFSSVIVLGHSEGSLIGMIAAAREPVKAYISVAGLGNRADKIIVRQIAAQSEELSLKAAFMLDSMTKGLTVTNSDPALASLFRPSVQAYIQSWLKYEPLNEIKRLSCPVLIVQGTTDLQVNESEAETLKEAYPQATLKIVKGMNHVLKLAPEDRAANMATYNKPELPISKEFAASVTGFVNGLGH